MKNVIKIETWLPLFIGFYETYLNGDSDIDNYLDDTNLNYDDLNIDYDKYHQDVSKWMVNEITELLKEIGIDCTINYQNLISPKEYNFSTDSINIEIELSPETLKSIKKLIDDNFDGISKIIKDDYTSRSGFISSHSNDINDWKINTKNWSDFSENGHYLGKVLEMLLLVSNDEIEETIMNDFFESENSLSQYITVK